jgi:mannose-6-phosphate isomerase-like protein (cupin superfamily)
LINQTEPKQPIREIKEVETLIHPDGRTVTFLDQGIDEKGEYLLVEHRVTRQGAMNGPHWHPVLTESFVVKEGRLRFFVDGKEQILGPDGQITIYPNQVHQFWKVGEDQLVAIHEIRPPGLHRNMFELVHKLESEGKMNKKGIPINPLWLGLAWKCIDGFQVGPPPIVQKVFLGGLARLAKVFGYRI